MKNTKKIFELIKANITKKYINYVFNSGFYIFDRLTTIRQFSYESYTYFPGYHPKFNLILQTSFTKILLKIIFII